MSEEEIEYLQVDTIHGTSYYRIANDSDYEHLIRRQTYPAGLLFEKHLFVAPTGRPSSDKVSDRWWKEYYVCNRCKMNGEHPIHEDQYA